VYDCVHMCIDHPWVLELCMFVYSITWRSYTDIFLTVAFQPPETYGVLIENKLSPLLFFH